MWGRGRRGFGGGGVGAVVAEVPDSTVAVTLAVGAVVRGAVVRGVCVCRDPADTGGPAAVPPEREIA
jgi:hypothetical protein